MIKEITVQELKNLKDENFDFLLLDVRDQIEYDVCHLDGLLIPLPELPQRTDELNPNQKIIVHCKGGGRSARAVQYLEQLGFKDVANLKGGISAWWNEIDTSVSKY